MGKAMIATFFVIAVAVYVAGLVFTPWFMLLLSIASVIGAYAIGSRAGAGSENFPLWDIVRFGLVVFGGINIVISLIAVAVKQAVM